MAVLILAGLLAIALLAPSHAEEYRRNTADRYFQASRFNPWM